MPDLTCRKVANSPRRIHTNITSKTYWDVLPVLSANEFKTIYICIKDIVNNVMPVSCANKQLKWSVAPCKGIRIPESGKCFVESGILGFGIRNPGFTDKESGIQYLETGIKNPRMSCIGFPKIVLHSSYKGRDQSDLPELINTNRDTFRSVGFLHYITFY